MASRRTWLTATFWLDTLERVIRTLIAAVLGFLTQGAWPSSSDWQVIGFSCLATLLLALLASGIGEPGTASIMNPAPPDTLKDAGYSSIRLLFIVTTIALGVGATLAGRLWLVAIFGALAGIQLMVGYLEPEPQLRRDRGESSVIVIVVIAILAVLAVLYILDRV